MSIISPTILLWVKIAMMIITKIIIVILLLCYNTPHRVLWTRQLIPGESKSNVLRWPVSSVSPDIIFNTILAFTMVIITTTIMWRWRMSDSPCSCRGPWLLRLRPPGRPGPRWWSCEDDDDDWYDYNNNKNNYNKPLPTRWSQLRASRKRAGPWKRRQTWYRSRRKLFRFWIWWNFRWRITKKIEVTMKAFSYIEQKITLVIKYWSVNCKKSSAAQLRYLQTLNSISAEHNSTIIFPMPIRCSP